MQSVGSVKIMTGVEAGADGSLLTPSVVPGAVIADFDALLNAAAALPATDAISPTDALGQPIKLTTTPGNVLPEAASPESGEMVNSLTATMRLATRGMTAREPMAKISIKIEAPVPAFSPEIQIRFTDDIKPTLDAVESTVVDPDLITLQPLPDFIQATLQHPVMQDAQIDLVDGEALAQDPVLDDGIPADATNSAPEAAVANLHEAAAQIQQNSTTLPATPYTASADTPAAEQTARPAAILPAQPEAPEPARQHSPSALPAVTETITPAGTSRPAQPMPIATAPVDMIDQINVDARPRPDQAVLPDTDAPDHELTKQIETDHITPNIKPLDAGSNETPESLDETRELVMSEVERVNAIASTIASMIPQASTPVVNAQGDVESRDDDTTGRQPAPLPLTAAPKLMSRDASPDTSKAKETAALTAPRPPEARDLAQAANPDAQVMAMARLQQTNSTTVNAAAPVHPDQDFVAQPAPAGGFSLDDQANAEEQAQQQAQQQADEQERDTNVSRDDTSARSNSATATRDGDRNAIRDIEITHVSKTEVTSRVVQENPKPTPELPPAAPANVSVQQVVVSNSEAGASNSRAQANEIRMRALEKQVVAAAREGSDTIRMQLYPPGLGQVVIRLTMEGGRLRLASRTMNQEATEAMLQIEKDLREALAGGGLELTQFDVSDEGEREDRRPQSDAKPTIHRSGNPEVFAVDMNA